MISRGHRGLKKQRDIVLDSVAAAAKTGNPKYLRMYALLLRGEWLDVQAESGCVEAMTELGGFLIQNGQFDVGMEFLLRAANCVSFTANDMIKAGLSASGAEVAVLLKATMDRVISRGYPALTWIMAEWLLKAGIDPVLVLRLFRRSFCLKVAFWRHCFPTSDSWGFLFGEHLWESWRIEYRLGNDLPLWSRRLPYVQRFEWHLTSARVG